MKPSKNPMFRTSLVAASMILTLTASHAAERTYRYYQYRGNVTRQNTATQLSEFQFKRAGAVVSMTGVTVTNPSGTSGIGDGEGALKLVDGSVETKWYDGNNSPVTFDFGTPTAIDAYNFATANDSDDRDPVSWSLYAGNDGSTWTLIDRRSYFGVTTERKVFQAADFALPTGPLIDIFSSTKTIALNGDSEALLLWRVSLADTVSINQGIGTVASDGGQPLVLPDSSDTTYTLTATSTEGTTTGQVTVRTVPSSTVNYRYLRYIPRKLRSDSFAVGIQLADFRFLNGNGVTGAEIVPVAVENILPVNTPAAEGSANLIDNNKDTKWLNFAKTGVIFDFGSAKNVTGYLIATANDDFARDPVRWTIEGSNDKTTWTLVDNVNAFDFNTPVSRKTDSEYIPFPGTTLAPFLSFTGDTVAVNGGGLALSWNVLGATGLALTGSPALPATDGAGSTIVVPTANTDYTLTATGAGGKTTAITRSVQVINPPVQTVSYTNFDQAGAELALLGNGTSITNVFATIPSPADAKRLRLTPAVNDRRGIAWARKRVNVGSGFEATFGLHVLSPGADGAAFVLQNSPLGTLAEPATSHELGLPSNALNISFDGYQNEGDPSAAVLRVLSGATVLATVDLGTVQGLVVGTSTGVPRLAKADLTSAPYQVRVTYLPGSLNVYMDGVHVITNLNVNLATAGAISSDGLAWAGFTSRTGGLSQSHDITSWTIGNFTAPTGGLTLLNYTVDKATSQVSLTWSSEAGANYRITSSPDLVNWNTILGAPVTGLAGQTSATRPFTGNPDKLFFRVEKP